MPKVECRLAWERNSRDPQAQGNPHIFTCFHFSKPTSYPPCWSETDFLLAPAREEKSTTMKRVPPDSSLWWSPSIQMKEFSRAQFWNLIPAGGREFLYTPALSWLSVSPNWEWEGGNIDSRGNGFKNRLAMLWPEKRVRQLRAKKTTAATMTLEERLKCLWRPYPWDTGPLKDWA